MKYGICLFLSILIGIFNSCGRNTIHNTKHQSYPKDSLFNDTYLIYCKDIKDSVIYFKKSLTTCKTDKILSLKEKPYDIVFNTINDTLIVINEQGVFSKPLSSKKQLLKIGEKFPFKSEYIGFGQAWIDSKTSRLRAILSYSFYDTLDSNYPKFNRLLNDSTNFLPDWGIDQIAFVLEMNHGKWKIIKEKATRGDACETPGLDVLIDEISPKKKTTSVNSEINFSSCAFKLKLSDSNIESLELKEVNRLLKKKVSNESDGYFKMRLNSEISLISEGCWTTETNPHFSNKIYLQNYKSGNYLFDNTLFKRFKEENYSTVAIQLTSKYILFSTDFNHEKPIVFDLISMKIKEQMNNVNSVLLLELID